MFGKSILLAVTVFFSVISSANAAAVVWFELGDNTPLFEDGPTGPNQVLRVQDACTGINGTLAVDLDMMATVTDTPLYSVSTTIRSNDLRIKATDWAAVPPSGGAATPATGLNNFGPGGVIAENFGAATFSGPGYFGENILLGTLTIEIDFSEPFCFDLIGASLFAQVGNGLWAQQNSQGALVRFGAGPFVDGAVAGAGGPPDSVIVQITPEPTTAVLLLMSCAGIGRRRRR